MKTGGDDQFLFFVAMAFMKREAKIQDPVNMVLVGLELRADHFRLLGEDALQERDVFLNLHAKRAFASAARFFQRLASEAVTDSRAVATSAGVKGFPASGVCAPNM